MSFAQQGIFSLRPAVVSSSSRILLQRSAAPAVAFFSTSPVARSNIGSSPITIPETVKVVVSDKQIDEISRLRMEINSKRRGKPVINLTQQALVKGPRGELTIDLADFVKLDIEDLHHSDSPESAGDALKKVTVRVRDEKDKPQRSMWGTTRSLLNNGIIGVTEGHIAIIKFVGTGFRASLEKDAAQNNREYISLKVGYCVPIRVDIPEGIKIQLPLPHRMIIEGNDKQQVKLLAAEIRKHRKPEPYKGKGIFVDGETIKLKARKIK